MNLDGIVEENRGVLQKPGVLVQAGDLFDDVKPKTRAYTAVFAALGSSSKLPVSRS